MDLRILPSAADGPVADPEIVAALESLLERAKAGEILGIAYACALAHNDWSCTAFLRAEGESKAFAFFALEQLRNRMLTE